MRVFARVSYSVARVVVAPRRVHPCAHARLVCRALAAHYRRTRAAEYAEYEEEHARAVPHCVNNNSYNINILRHLSPPRTRAPMPTTCRELTAGKLHAPAWEGRASGRLGLERLETGRMEHAYDAHNGYGSDRVRGTSTQHPPDAVFFAFLPSLS